MGFSVGRYFAVVCIGLLLAACPAHDRDSSPARQQASLSAAQLLRPAYQRLYLPLYPSAATPRLTLLGDFDTPRAYRGQAWRHRGIDVVGEPGDPVIAAAPGLACAGYDEINGKKVTLYPNLSPAPLDEADLGFVTQRHDSGEQQHALHLLYGHLRGIEPGLSPCRFVELGAVIGSMGSSGIASQPHLHFEIVVLDSSSLYGDPNLRGALNPFYLMRREPDQPLGTITCYEPGMTYRPNAGKPLNSLNIVWPTLTC